MKNDRLFSLIGKEIEKTMNSLASKLGEEILPNDTKDLPDMMDHLKGWFDKLTKETLEEVNTADSLFDVAKAYGRLEILAELDAILTQKMIEQLKGE